MIDKGAQFPIYQELLHINRKKTSHYKDVQKGFGNTSKKRASKSPGSMLQDPQLLTSKGNKDENDLYSSN